MEGGLNFPFEILEPVGKPQLFKCRKSWFYKMLIWSALGTSEQQGSEWAPSPFSLNPARLLYLRVSKRWRVTTRVEKIRCVLFTCTRSLSTWSCTGRTSEFEWCRRIIRLLLSLYYLLLFLPHPSHLSFLNIFQPPSPHGHMVTLEAWEIMTAFLLCSAFSPSEQLWCKRNEILLEKKQSLYSALEFYDCISVCSKTTLCDFKSFERILNLL